MTPRDFIVTPSLWLTDPRLNNLSDDAELLFRRMASCTDKHWRFAVDPENAEHVIRTACFSPQRRFRAWHPDRIRRGLNALTAAGMLTRHYHGDRHWIEVAEAYRYEKGRDPMGIAPPPEQQELPDLGPPLFALPDSGPVPVARSGIPRRTEKKRTDPDSPRAKPVKIAAPLNQDNCAENGKDSRFARSPDAIDDHIWPQLCKAVGNVEMQERGALWMRRYRLLPDLVNTVLKDLPADLRNGKGAAWLNAAFENNQHKRSA